MSPSASGPVAGDAVHDHVVDAGADHRRVAVVAEEVRLRAPPGQHLAPDRVELGQRDARAQRRPGCARASRPRPGRPAAWCGSRLGGAAAHRCCPPRAARCPAARLDCGAVVDGRNRRSVTSSVVPSPSITSSRPRSPYQAMSGRRLGLVLGQALLDGGRRVVVALHDVAAAVVAHPAVLGRRVDASSWPRSRRTPAGRPAAASTTSLATSRSIDHVERAGRR